MTDKTEPEIIKNWEGEKTKPLVSICCIAYNHENYINEALDSFLMQVTDFPFEIIVRDDASVDSTAEVIKEYKKKFPNIIKPIYETTNQYTKGIKPFPVTYKNAVGKYIALCESDDYWIDKNKLQKQVNFLEKNSDYNFSVSSYHTIDEKKKIKLGESFRTKTNNLLIRDYIAKRFSQTSTFVFRNNFELPSWFSKIYANDQALLLLVTKDKKIKYHNEVFSTYRLHEKGIDTLYSNYSERNKKYILLLENIKSLTNDWKCKVIIIFKIHTTSIKNYSLKSRYEIILKGYTGFMNKIIVPLLNNFLNWI